MWYSPTSIISLALLALRPKLVLLRTDVLSKLSLCFSFCFCFCLPCLRNTASLYFCDTGSHVVRAMIHYKLQYCLNQLEYSQDPEVMRRPAITRRCPWCSRYRRRKWTRRHEFKSWTRLIAFHIALIPLGKVWIQLFSLQLWVNSRTG